MELFAWLEADSLAGSDGDFRACPWVAADAGFSWFYGEDAEASEFDAVARNQGLLHALENSVYRSLCFRPWQSGALNNPLYKILLNHYGPPSLGCNFFYKTKY
jgi:hypothetical protein